MISSDENPLASIGLNIGVDGKQTKSWPKHCLDTLDGDLKDWRLHPNQAFDKAKWQNRLGRANPTSEKDKDRRRKRFPLISAHAISFEPSHILPFDSFFCKLTHFVERSDFHLERNAKKFLKNTNHFKLPTPFAKIVKVDEKPHHGTNTVLSELQ